MSLWRHPNFGPSTRRPSLLTHDIDIAGDLLDLANRVRSHGIVLDEQPLQRLTVFGNELLECNERYNLMSRKDIAGIVRKHIAISLAPLLHVGTFPGRGAESWIDIGTGGGLPGLVMKAVVPDLGMTLLEPSAKKCLFLERTARKMGVDVTIVQKRAEGHVEKDRRRGDYAVAVCRAVAGLGDSLMRFGPLVSVGGTFITFKGASWNAEVVQAMQRGKSRISLPGFRLARVMEVAWTPGHVLSLRREPQPPLQQQGS